MAGAARTEGEIGAVIPVLVRREALIWIIAGHDTHLGCGSNTERSCFATICNVTLRAVPNAMGNKVIVTYLPGYVLRRATNRYPKRDQGRADTGVNAESVIRAGNPARSVEIIVRYRSLSAHEIAGDRVCPVRP